MASFISGVVRLSDDFPINPETRDEEGFIAQSLNRFHLSAEATAQLRREALDDHMFVAGEQWDPMNRESRIRDARPSLTMNRLRAFRRMVTNEQRQQRPAIQINPVGDEATIAVAEVLQGLIRHIEVNSDAEIAYDGGFSDMVTGGFGYWRLITDYVDDESDEQEIFFKRVRNPFSVYFDPRCQEPDYSDALWCHIIDDMPRELYREEFGEASLASMDNWISVGDRAADWITRETVRVAEYFWVEIDRRDPRTMGTHSVKRTVHWAKINAIKILDGPKNVPARYIPVIPVLGDDSVIDGKRNLVGMIRDAKDAQRFYNYQISAAAEAIALAPKAPWTVAEGQIEGHELDWEQSNRRNLAVLQYKPMSSANGAPMPPPQRNVSEPPIQAMAAMIRQADNDMKAVTGIYDASLGQQGPEQSGKAVLLRQKQSDVANLNYTDNLARAIRHTGRILVDMIPRIYDVPHVRHIIDPEEQPRMVGIYNGQVREPDPDELAELGAIQEIYDIGVGRYDVTVSVGPSYQSKRQEAVASMLALISSAPQILGVAGDLLVRNMDWPFADQIADRMKALLPPQIQQQMQGQGNDQAGAQQQQQAAMQQAMQQNQVLTQLVQNQNEIIRSKQLEGQTRTNIALIDQQTKLAVARITASKDQDTAAADREQSMLEAMMGQAHDAGQQASDQGHEMAMQQGDQAHQIQLNQMQPPPQAAPGQAPPGVPPAPPGGP